MKISIVSYGHVDSITELSRSLAARGNKTQLFIVVYDDRFTNSIVDFNLSDIPLGIHPINVLAGTSDDTDKFIKYCDVFDCYLVKLPSRSFKHFNNLIYIYRCVRMIRNFHSEVVHFNGDSAHQVSFAAMLGKIPKVLTIHDLIPHSGEGGNKFQNSVFRKIHYRSKYLFIQHSELYAKMMAEITTVPRENIFLVYYGPFNFYHEYSFSEEKFPSVLFFGRISKYKGLRYFCEAAKIINAKDPEVRFTIMGGGKPDFDITWFTENLNLEFINRHISNQELVNALTSHSFVAIPYTDATQSGVVLTAYTFNKPVIASKVGGIPEVVVDGETGFLIPAENPEALAEKIFELIRNPEQLAKMREIINEQRISGSSRYLSWKKIVEETENVYHLAIKRFS